MNANILEKMLSRTELKKLICSENRHDLSNFLYAVAEAKKIGYVDDEHFALFREGYAVDCVLSLDQTLKEQGRTLQSAELLDKINYLSLVPDVESLNTTFTHPQIVDGVIKGNRDLSWWYSCGTLETLPTETKLKFGMKLMESGDMDKATEVFKIVNHDLEYQRKSDMEKKTSQR